MAGERIDWASAVSKFFGQAATFAYRGVLLVLLIASLGGAALMWSIGDFGKAAKWFIGCLITMRAGYHSLVRQ